MLIETRSSKFQISNPGGNSTAASIVEPLPSLTSPDIAAVSTGVTSVGDGVIALGGGSAGIPGGIVAPNSLILVPYGAGSSTQTFTMKVYAWRRTLAATGPPTQFPIWVPYLLASFTVTLGTAPGLATADVNASQLFATTIVLVTGNANISNEIVSPGSNVLAHIVLDAKGAQFVEFRYAVVTATSANCLVATL